MTPKESSAIPLHESNDLGQVPLECRGGQTSKPPSSSTPIYRKTRAAPQHCSSTDIAAKLIGRKGFDPHEAVFGKLLTLFGFDAQRHPWEGARPWEGTRHRGSGSCCRRALRRGRAFACREGSAHCGSRFSRSRFWHWSRLIGAAGPSMPWQCHAPTFERR